MMKRHCFSVRDGVAEDAGEVRPVRAGIARKADGKGSVMSCD